MSPPALATASHAFRIFVADGAPDSVQALATLYAICRTHFPQSHRIEVVDITRQPLRALAEAIVATPTVMKLSPAPPLRIIGNLSEEGVLLRALGLPAHPESAP